MSEPIFSCRAIALQVKTFAVNRAKSKDEADEIINQSIERISRQIVGAIAVNYKVDCVHLY